MNWFVNWALVPREYLLKKRYIIDTLFLCFAFNCMLKERNKFSWWLSIVSYTNDTEISFS